MVTVNGHGGMFMVNGQSGGRSPLDCALQVGLADRTVVDEYGGTRAVLLGEEARGELRHSDYDH